MDCGSATRRGLTASTSGARGGRACASCLYPSSTASLSAIWTIRGTGGPLLLQAVGVEGAVFFPPAIGQAGSEAAIQVFLDTMDVSSRKIPVPYPRFFCSPQHPGTIWHFGYQRSDEVPSSRPLPGCRSV